MNPIFVKYLDDLSLIERVMLKTYGENGKTALHEAISRGFLHIAVALLDRKYEGQDQFTLNFSFCYQKGLRIWIFASLSCLRRTIR
jgi:ankyrin repeat protein